jgi:hypothetical protein
MDSKDVDLKSWTQSQDLGLVRAMTYKFPNKMSLGEEFCVELGAGWGVVSRHS